MDAFPETILRSSFVEEIRRSGYGHSQCPANRRKKIPYMWNGGFQLISRLRKAQAAIMAKALDAWDVDPGGGAADS
jgi:hypothetical protein